ncbi:MAG: cyclic pyranopterin monophosphate synthase MoaC [Mogibacterium sp.]|nr:cyclic pyranopterin monophosphate synthase MoaC [Mogibacterium sp.]
MKEFTHFDERGNAYMVDVSGKDITKRTAKAEGSIKMSPEAMDAVLGKKIKKGDVLTVAQLAGIMGTKKTSDLIPLCHPIALTNAKLEFEIDEEACEIKAVCTAESEGKTGVEMEALTGVSIALLTVYDMCKAVDKRMEIKDIHLVSKTGGKSGDFIF